MMEENLQHLLDEPSNVVPKLTGQASCYLFLFSFDMLQKIVDANKNRWRVEILIKISGLSMLMNSNYSFDLWMNSIVQLLTIGARSSFEAFNWKIPESQVLVPRSIPGWINLKMLDHEWLMDACSS